MCNISSTMTFDKVVATSSSYAFEFDNVAFGTASVPEPSSFVLAIIGGLGALGYKVVRRRGSLVGNRG